VLARILQDRGMQHSHLGSLALTASAVADVTAWCLLALVVGVIKSDLSDAGRTALMTGAYLAAMIWGVRPLVKKLVARYDERPEIGQAVIAGLCLMLLLSSLATEFIGIHTLFGAFLMGAIIPHESRVAKVLQEKLHDVVVVLFLPAFFAFSGLRTQVGLIAGNMWLLCAVIIAVACIGKIAGTGLAARACGMNGREATSLGVLMNTRGLMELIVLNIGLDLKVISPTLFAMLVLMALITTFATTPLLDWLTSLRKPAVAPVEAAVTP
jgi:Kef-type K+ transport system membrane component KefB